MVGRSVGFFWFVLFPRDIEVKGAISLSVLADTSGQENAGGEAVA